MSNTAILDLSVRENETLNRLVKYRAISDLLKSFFDKGFRSYPALKSIVCHYYPNIDKFKLKQLWNFKSIDADIILMLEDVFEKLKNE